MVPNRGARLRVIAKYLEPRAKESAEEHERIVVRDALASFPDGDVMDRILRYQRYLDRRPHHLLLTLNALKSHERAS